MPDRLSRPRMRETGRADEAMVCFVSCVEYPWDKKFCSERLLSDARPVRMMPHVV